MAAQNGRLPDSVLAPIPGGARLLTSVAVTWLAICAEVYRLHGWIPRPTGPTDGYRTYAVQVATFNARYTRTRLPGRPTKTWNGVTYWLLPRRAPAAVPGKSNHGWGAAVDVTGLGGFDGVRYRQFAAVAARFGWTNSEGRKIGEAWHWVDVGTANLVSRGLLDLGQVPDGGHLITTAPAPAALKRKEPAMRVIQGYGDPRRWSTDGVTVVELTTDSQVKDMLFVADQEQVIVVGMETVQRLLSMDRRAQIDETLAATTNIARGVANVSTNLGKVTR